MKLAGFDLYRYELPFAEPVTLQGAALRHREGLLLRLTTDDGGEGWGEAAPLQGFSRETPEQAARQLHGLSDLVLGAEVSPDWWRSEGDPPGSDQTSLAPSARSALELAAWNLYVASNNETVPSKRRGEPVPVNGLISVSSEKALEEASSMVRAGYRVVKIKVGAREIDEDVRLVKGVREVLGDDVGLRLDANRAWGFDEAVQFSRGVSGVGVEYVEEPLLEPGRLEELARGWGLPVALDESLVGMGPGELGRHGYARAVVLKPTLLGGISRTLALAERALRLGMTPVISACYESGVGTAGLVALAAAVEERPAPAGLDTYRRLAADVIRETLDLPAPQIDPRRATAAARKLDMSRLQPIAKP